MMRDRSRLVGQMSEFAQRLTFRRDLFRLRMDDERQSIE